MNSNSMMTHQTDMNITKINKYNKKLNSTSTTKTKTNKYTLRLRYIINT